MPAYSAQGFGFNSHHSPNRKESKILDSCESLMLFYILFIVVFITKEATLSCNHFVFPD